MGCDRIKKPARFAYLELRRLGLSAGVSAKNAKLMPDLRKRQNGNGRDSWYSYAISEKLNILRIPSENPGCCKDFQADQISVEIFSSALYLLRLVSLFNADFIWRSCLMETSILPEFI